MKHSSLAWPTKAAIQTLRWLLAVLISATPTAVRSAQLSGVAQVVDGDTLIMDGVKIRFDGIDAPETDQVCLDAQWRRWTCGITARDRLTAKLGRQVITCATGGNDLYGRVLASCSLGREDIQKWLVQEGLALSFRRYSHVYDRDEDIARTRRIGLWAGAFVAPWDWRSRNVQTVVLGAVSVPLSARPELLTSTPSANPPTSQCVIKGNVSRTGERIFHVPGQRYYGDTRMDKGMGERWFCTEVEAQAAGWRKSLR